MLYHVKDFRLTRHLGTCSYDTVYKLITLDQFLQINSRIRKGSEAVLMRGSG